MRNRPAFTLAEVLITLGVIGVVAALTMPSLIAKYDKLRTVTKLKKFYSVMNQAVNKSIVQNGEVADWDMPAETYPSTLEFYDKYLAEHLIITKKEQCNTNNLCVYFSDGTYMRLRGRSYGLAAYFYLKKPSVEVEMTSRNGFPFVINRTANASLKDQWEPYTPSSGWDGQRESLFSGGFACQGNNHVNTNINGNCAKIIQLDGWEIKDDYPW